MNKRIDVTAEDIAFGCASNSHNCPVAMAVRRAFNLHQSAVCVGVGGTIISLVNRGVWLAHPAQISKFIVDFDHRRVVKPFSFMVVIDSANGDRVELIQENLCPSSSESAIKTSLLASVSRGAIAQLLVRLPE